MKTCAIVGIGWPVSPALRAGNTTVYENAEKENRL